MKIADYKCHHNNSSGVEESIIAESKLSFPEVYKSANGLAQLSKIAKNAQNDNFCMLPFCHTVEGEAMGASINLGDALHGPRAKDYCCQTIEDVLALEDIDFSKGRIAEVIKAASILKSEGEEVVLFLSGPFTILNVLIDPVKVFKVFRKSPNVMALVFSKLQKQLLNYVQAIKNEGVNVVSYADSSGGLNILGPKFFDQTLEIFTVDTLKKMGQILGKDGLVMLCPKTTLGLVSTGRAEWGFVDVGSEKSYRDACIDVIGKAQFIGETCIKNNSYKVKNKQVRTVTIL